LFKILNIHVRTDIVVKTTAFYSTHCRTAKIAIAYPFLARDSIIAYMLTALYAIARPSVRPSHG